MNNTVAVALLGAMSAIPLVAASQTDAHGTDTEKLSEIVVVATRSSRQVLDVAATVSVMDADQIASNLSMSVQDLVRYEPAISVPRSSTRFGASNYKIRGIGGNRVAVEIDGVPISDQFDIGSFANSERDLVDIGLVQRVEILRGPASTLYGSNAVGGVVAYATLEPEGFGEDLARLNTSYQSDSHTLSTSASTALEIREFSALVSATQRSGEQIESAALSGPEDQRDHSSTAVFLKGLWEPDYRIRFTGTVDVFNRDVDSNILSVLGAGRFSSTSLLQGADEQSRTRYSIAANADIGAALVESGDLLFFHQSAETVQNTIEERLSSDLRRNRRFEFAQDTSGMKLRLDTEKLLGGWRHRIGYGVDAKRSKIVELRNAQQTGLDGTGLTNELLGEAFPLRDFPISRTTEIGVYVHDEISLADSRWSLIPALRYDHYDLAPSVDAIYRDDNPDQTPVSISDEGWSPKLGVLYSMSDNTSLFAQMMHGFRAPPFEDANIGLDIPLFNIRALPNPELQSETSLTTEFGFRLRTASTSISATAHYTDYEDFIETRVRVGVDPETGVILFQSRNIEAAHIYGLELSAEHALAKRASLLRDFDVRLALAWTKGQNDQSGEALIGVDPPQATVRLRWQPSQWPINMSLHATLTDRPDGVSDPDQFSPPGHAVYDFLSSVQLGKFTIRGGLFNLSNKTYWRWSDISGLSRTDPLIDQLSAPGRNARISLSFSW